MKRVSLLLLAALAICGLAHAQNAQFGNGRLTVPTDLVVSTRAAGSNLINTNATRDFVKFLGNATDIKWYRSDKGFYVTYSIHSKTGKRFYDRKGNLVYNILAYSNEFLPPGIRIRLLSSYYSPCDVTWIEEIEAHGKTTFIVHLHNKKTWTNLKISDNETEVLEEYSEG